MEKKEDLLLLIENLRETVLKVYNYPEFINSEAIQEIISSKEWLEFIENLTKLKIHLNS